ncbi:MAG: thioredoxin family protein [Rhodospirillaceae bacterium]|nr:thioredoxin family protein [Rhodospirillaceae bacterium]
MTRLLVLLIGLLCTPALAEEPLARTDQTEVRLIVNLADQTPGQPITLGVAFDLAPGWHIYAQNPGDAGLPTEVDWILPPGTTHDDLAYPPATRFDEGGLITFGYADHAVLTTRATPPETNQPLHIGARVTWLACKTICIPGSANLSLTLPLVSGTSRPSPEPLALAQSDAPPLIHAPTRPGPWMAIGLAVLGGILLNLMPCVFPVLALKILHVANLSTQAEGRIRARRDSTLYACGVLAGFAALGGLLNVLTSGGAALGWGFQLQSPAMVLILALLMALVGLDLSGALPLGGLPTTLQARLPATQTPFLTGLLAVAVASPCTAPFMGAAVGFAAVQTPLFGFAVILAVGAGFALPFATIGWVPGLARLLPKPGPWMGRLRHILAWPMFAAAAWLIWVLARQTDAQGLSAAAFLGFILILATVMPKARRIAAPVLAIALIGAATIVEHHPAPQPTATNGTYSDARLAQLRAENRAVFVDFTAAWCLTCQINKRTTLTNASVEHTFAEKGVVRLTADWTQRDPKIGAALARLGRNGVPAYALYRPGQDTPTLLPELLTPSIVREALSALPPPSH